MSRSVAVLVSSGRHPITDRPRRSLPDAWAAELALRTSADAVALHAGAVDDPVLRHWLGMSIRRVVVSPCNDGDDVVPALQQLVRCSGAGIVFAGDVAERSEGTGLVPYLVAEGLGFAVVADVVAIEEVSETRAVVLQNAGKGWRRRIEAALPVVLIAASGAGKPRQVAVGAMRSGSIAIQVVAGRQRWSPPWVIEDRTKNPLRGVGIRAGMTPEQRLAALTSFAPGAKRQVIRNDPEAAAQAILEQLAKSGVAPHTEPAKQKGDPQ